MSSHRSSLLLTVICLFLFSLLGVDGLQAADLPMKAIRAFNRFPGALQYSWGYRDDCAGRSGGSVHNAECVEHYAGMV